MAGEFNDYPFNEVCRTAEEKMQQGFDVYQKFTCAKCGSRQTIDTPNIFHKLGRCEECKHITNIEKRGCNYLLMSRGLRT
jgi:hypothetical protein